MPRGKTPSSVTHGAEFYLRTGKLPSIKGRRLLARYIKSLEKDLREALGDDLTPQREVMVRQVLRCENVLRLIELYLVHASPMRPGVSRGRLELQPCLANSYGHFLNVQRQALLALGLDQKSERLGLPWEEPEEKAEGEKEAKGEGHHSGGS
jgi:hypothetical protein